MSGIQARAEHKHERFAFSGKGTIYSYTVVEESPESFSSQAPYVLALIRLDEGPLITAQLTDLDSFSEISIGDRVEMVTRKLAVEGSKGMIIYGYKFRRPLQE